MIKTTTKQPIREIRDKRNNSVDNPSKRAPFNDGLQKGKVIPTSSSLTPHKPGDTKDK